MRRITPETAIKKSIKDYLRLSGWFVFSIMQGLGSYAGIADFFAIKNGWGIWIEVKSEKGTQSEYQIKFEKDIKEHGGRYILVRSVDELNEYIEKEFNERSLLRL